MQNGKCQYLILEKINYCFISQEVMDIVMEVMVMGIMAILMKVCFYFKSTDN